MAQHIFISYCRDNKTEVAELVKELEAAGLKIWWDSFIEEGKIGWDKVCEKIDDSYKFVVCLSKELETREKSGVFRELAAAKTNYLEINPEKNSFIIPLRLSDCKIPFVRFDETRKLSDLQYIDLFPAAARAENLARLIKLLQPAETKRATRPAGNVGAKSNSVKKPKTARPHLGSCVSKSCDRHHQESQFRTFFLADKKKKPQFCIIHGDEEEGHESLVERFYTTIIRQNAKAENARRNVVSLHRNSKYTELSLRYGYLQNELFTFLDQSYEYTRKPQTGEALIGLLENRKEKTLVFQHNAVLSENDGNSISLLKDYVNFWDELPISDRTPEIIVFLNIFYAGARTGKLPVWRQFRQWTARQRKEQIKKALHRELTIGERSLPKTPDNDLCPCIILDELPCVKPVDILKWFKEHNIHTDKTLSERESEANRLFLTEKSKAVQCRPMSDIEPLLVRIIKNIEPDFEAYEGKH